jgi:hypothetical protein
VSCAARPGHARAVRGRVRAWALGGVLGGLLGGLLGGSLGCSLPALRVPRYGPHVGDEPQAVPYPPPPALVTVVPEPPPGDRGERVWLDGEWQWKSGRWAWVAGRWERPPAPSAYWAPAVTARLGDGSLVHFVGRWHLPRS